MTLVPQQQTLDQGTSQVPRCDNASVGVLITAAGRYLMFARRRPPAGIAPVAGHVWDEHASYTAAAEAEVREELGLTVTRLRHLTAGWLPNRCRRGPGPRGVGHQWEIFHAEVTGQIDPAAEEAAHATWLTRRQVQALAERTVTYARGHLSDAEFAAEPGIEPAWVLWLAELQIVTGLSEGDLFLVEHVARRGGVR